MKKTILTLVVLNFLFFAFAQEEEVEVEEEGTILVSKKGIPILPESGEFSIGISAMPFFEYVGNIFNGTVNNGAPGFKFTSEFPMMITGKYMLDENTAIRGIFRVGYGNEKEIGNSPSNADFAILVEDTWTASYLNLGIGGGLEKRRGKGRVQGLYGGQAIISLTSSKNTYEYGNAIDATYTNPSRTNWGQGVDLLEDSNDLGFGVAIQGFVGAEFFFAPKMSLSGEFTYGLHFNTIGKNSITTENWDFGNGSLLTETTESGGGSSFGLDTGIGAFLNLNFYF
jgi:hypothetical protein